MAGVVHVEDEEGDIYTHGSDDFSVSEHGDLIVYGAIAGFMRAQIAAYADGKWKRVWLE